MLNKFGYLAIVGFAMVPAVASADWLKPITLDAQTTQPIRDIPKTEFFEVTVSKKDAAQEMLKNVPVVSGEEVGYFGQRNFRCPTGKNPYLIRANFTNGGTGDFVVRRYGTALLVGQGSLGASSEVERTALVVCVDFQPTAIYGSISGAM